MWNWLRPRDSEWCWLIVGVCVGFLVDPLAHMLARALIQGALFLMGRPA